MNELFQVILLGIIEGLTEFIPVSSTGHLILVAEFIELSLYNKESFSIFIQLGAILAVLVLYRNVFIDILKGLSGKSWQSENFGALHIIAGCLPVFILGFLFHKAIKLYLFNSFTVALALIVGGVVLILVEKRKTLPATHEINNITLKQAFFVGIFQCFALWPGMSRSGSTIVGGLLAGLDRKTAAEFSFLIAVPVMFVAVGYDTFKTMPQLTSHELMLFALGFLVSFIVALLTIKVFLGLLQRVTFVPFGVYRILLGFLVIGFSFL